VFRIPRSAIRVPYSVSAFPVPHAVFRNPRSAIRISFAICYSSSESGDWNKNQPDAPVLAYVITAYVAPGRTKIA
jgi:hypothetical protein